MPDIPLQLTVIFNVSTWSYSLYKLCRSGLDFTRENNDFKRELDTETCNKLKDIKQALLTVKHIQDA